MIWYEIPEVHGYRINHRGDVLSLKGKEPLIISARPVVDLLQEGRYVTYRICDLMISTGLTPALGLQAPTHHEAARDACDQGHRFTPENTMRRTGRNGNHIRKCRECHRIAVAKWRAKKRTATLSDEHGKENP